MKVWLRYNIWALVVLPLVLVAVALPEVTDLYHRFFVFQYTVPVEVAKGQPAAYHESTVRLVDLGRVQLTEVYGGAPVDVPSGYAFWKFDVAFVVPEPSWLGGCDVFLEDQLGRQFPDDVKWLAGTGAHSEGCSDYDNPSLSFTRAMYFLLPPGATPHAVRIEVATAQPRFVRLLTD